MQFSNFNILKLWLMMFPSDEIDNPSDLVSYFYYMQWKTNSNFQ